MAWCFCLLNIFLLSSVEALTFRPAELIVADTASLDCSKAFQARASGQSAARLGLVHKNAPCSPLMEAHSAPLRPEDFFQELRNMEPNRIGFLQSKLQATSAAASQPVISGSSMGTGNYLLKVGLGTPAKELLMVLDTGSDLAWTQCTPCALSGACFSQTDPIFDPSASASYKDVPCGSASCSLLGSDSAATCSASGSCEYLIQYLDGSFTRGDFATDTLTVGGKTVLSYAFGCGHDNEGLFVGMDGLLGFDKTPLAFSQQTRSIFGGTFAYCLPSPFSSSSGFIEFGTAPGVGASVTPMVSMDSAPLYMVHTESVVVGTSLPIVPTTGTTIVDSGTIISRLDRSLYVAVRDAFRKEAASLTPAPSSAGQGIFDTCYSIPAMGTVQIPAIIFNLMGGVKFAPPAANLLYPIDMAGTYCLAFAPVDSGSGLSILGNYQQQGYKFTFDTTSSILGIEANSC